MGFSLSINAGTPFKLLFINTRVCFPEVFQIKPRRVKFKKEHWGGMCTQRYQLYFIWRVLIRVLKRFSVAFAIALKYR